MSLVIASYRLDARRRAFALALGLALPVVHVTVAFAQDSDGASGGAGVTSTAPAGQAGGTTTTVVQGQPSYQFFPGGVAPTPPGGVLGGGNAQFSSSKPISGNERDSFDFQRGGGAEGTLRGDPNGSFIIGGPDRGVRGPAPGSHLVRRGDTLWGICDFYFQNPYQWPRIWSYNAQIQNPHWIYPGDVVNLRSGASDALPQAEPAAAGRSASLTDRRRQLPADTIFLRNEGFIDDESNDWGEITGAREDKMFLSDFDEAYIRIRPKHDIKVGQELTIYRPIKSVGGGRLVEIQGTAKVDQWNAKDRIARARITETLDTIERGARVGPVERRFEVVPPARNEKDVEAKILTSLRPHDFYGQNQIVFLDKGAEAGLAPGNRLFVIRQGDGFHQTQPTGSAAKRIALENASPAATESIPKPRDERALPEEVLAELRVISVRKNTAMALVTAARREIETGDKAFARRGY